MASAMDEIADTRIGLDELVTPICVMESSKVDVFPYVIKDHEVTRVNWEPVTHESLAALHSLETQWHTRSVGRERLAKEQELFNGLGVEVDLREGADGSYQFHVSPGAESPLRLVMLCPAEYPVAPPEVAVYHQDSKKYEPVTSDLLDHWNIYQHLADLVEEWQNEHHHHTSCEESTTTIV